MTTPSPTLSREDVQRRATEFSWYHSIDLGHGVTTAGVYDLSPIVHQYGLPESLAGQHVLDVGPGHGFFAFECERRGARVATAELPDWTEHDASPKLRQAFQDTPDSAAEYHRGALGFAIQARGSGVQRHFCNVYDLAPAQVGTYDVVFCASVLLHLTDPLRALYGMRRVCRREVIVSTAVDTDPKRKEESIALFIGTAEGQVFWVPTLACLEGMLRAAGFTRVERVSEFELKSVDGLYNTPHATLRAFVD